MHPPTTYLGWRALGVALHLPLFAPHWHCVEALRMIDDLLRAQPTLAVLDSEDTRAEEGGEAGPFPLNRPRVLANWERLHAADCAGRADVYRMDRLASLALWRYRRERAAGMAAQPELVWPEALALLDERTARSAAFWNDPARGLALPPVELVIVRRGEAAGVLPNDELLTAAGGGAPLGHGKAVAILPGPRLADLHAKARLLPIARFKALSDQDWSD